MDKLRISKSGSGIITAIPDFIGQIYVDEINGNIYKANSNLTWDLIFYNSGLSENVLPKNTTTGLINSNIIDDGTDIKFLNKAGLILLDNNNIGWRFQPNTGGTLEATHETEQWYGIQYDSTVASPTLTRIASNMNLHATLPVHNLLKACILNDDLTVNYYLDPTDWTKKIDGTPSKLDGTDGQVMIRKTASTYWKYETIGNVTTIKCSLYPISGYTESGIWNVGAYEAALQRSNLKLSSVKSTNIDFRGGDNTNWDTLSKSLLGKPATVISRTNFRTYARNRGTGWNQLSYDLYKELVWLFCIEYATFNSQLAVNSVLTAEGYKQGGLGNGVTASDTTEWSNFNGYRPFINCGATDTLGTSSGEISVDVEDFGGVGVTRTVTVNRYRGIENIFGHIWKWIDGINLYDFNAYVMHDPINFADNTSGNTVNIGVFYNTSGWYKTLLNGHEILPSTAGGDNTTYMCDYFYNGGVVSTWYALLVGGCADTGAYAGLFVAYANVGASLTYANVGGRLQAR